MKSRSKRTVSGTGATEGMERSRRLRQTAPAKSPRQTKKRSAQSAGSVVKPEVMAGLQVVRFELIAPSAREVFLAGTFNNWKCGAMPMSRAEGGKWVAELTLHHGVYEYRFVVDGEWKLDPSNMESVHNPFGESNSLLIIGPFSSPGQKPCP